MYQCKYLTHEKHQIKFELIQLNRQENFIGNNKAPLVGKTERGFIQKSSIIIKSDTIFRMSQIYGKIRYYARLTMHNIKENFDNIKNAITIHIAENHLLRSRLITRGPNPKFTDIDVIALSLTAECMSITSESYLFAIINSSYKKHFPNLISRRQFNDRRRALLYAIISLRDVISSEMIKPNEKNIIDSMPIDVCKIARTRRNKMGTRIGEIRANVGKCASQKRWFFGYRLHVVCSENKVIKAAVIKDGATHDSKFLPEVHKYLRERESLLIGDMAYIGKRRNAKIYKQHGIKIETPFRKNQKEYDGKPFKYGGIRKRIETVFSQLADQFSIQKNYAKGFTGLLTRVHSKICGFTVSQYLNFTNNKSLGSVKYALQNKFKQLKKWLFKS